jgi:hypothetical protein
VWRALMLVFAIGLTAAKMTHGREKNSSHLLGRGSSMRRWMYTIFVLSGSPRRILFSPVDGASRCWASVSGCERMLKRQTSGSRGNGTDETT